MSKPLTVKQFAALPSVRLSVGRIRTMLGNGQIPGAVKDETPRGPVWMIPRAAAKAIAGRRPGRPPAKVI